MAFSLVRSEQAELDLELIFRHLIESYLSLGEELSPSIERAEARLNRIEQDIRALVRMPYQGTISRPLGENVRHVTKDRAIIYFQVDDAAHTITVLAVFFSGQNHQKHMANRLRPGANDA